MHHRSCTRRTLLALAFAATASQVLANDWPTQPLRIIVPTPAGGTMDFTARILARELAPMLKQPVLVENKAGAAGNIAAGHVAQAPSDGTVLLIGSSTLTTAPSLYKSLPYRLEADLQPVARLGFFTGALVVAANVPVTNGAEFVAYVRNPANKVHYGSGGSGSVAHLSGAIFNQLAGGHMTHVPYKGGAPAVLDAVSGRIETVIGSPLVEVMPHVKTGKLRLLGLTTTTRSALHPDVPTVAEFLPGYDSTTWNGIWLPAKTPPAIVQSLNAAIGQILRRPDVARQLADAGVDAAPQTSAEFTAFVGAEVQKWGRLVQQAGVQLD